MFTVFLYGFAHSHSPPPLTVAFGNSEHYMTSITAVSVIALALGAGFLAAAIGSSALKVILLTEVRQTEHPGAFRFLMCLYWLLGLAGIGVGVVTLFGGLRG